MTAPRSRLSPSPPLLLRSSSFTTADPPSLISFKATHWSWKLRNISPPRWKTTQELYELATWKPGVRMTPLTATPSDCCSSPSPAGSLYTYSIHETPTSVSSEEGRGMNAKGVEVEEGDSLIDDAAALLDRLERTVGIRKILQRTSRKRSRSPDDNNDERGGTEILQRTSRKRSRSPDDNDKSGRTEILQGICRKRSKCSEDNKSGWTVRLAGSSPRKTAEKPRIRSAWITKSNRDRASHSMVTRSKCKRACLQKHQHRHTFTRSRRP